MKRRLRKYVAVVMTLLLCLGLWFRHGQVVRAEGEQTATVDIYTDANTKVGSYDIAISNFSVKTAEDGGISFAGEFSLTADQTKGAKGYLLYWYATVDKMGTIATGNTPTIDLSVLSTYNITYSMNSNEAGTVVTYSDVVIKLFADYGASHRVIYDSNYQMGMSIISDMTSDVTAEEYYYQDALTTTEGVYKLPATPTFEGKTWVNTMTDEATGETMTYFFIGWGETDSGGVDELSGFKYGDREETTVTLYAQWQRPCKLTINYYSTEAEMQLQQPCYDPVTIWQESLTDTTFTFTTMPGAEMTGEFFAAWQYKNDDGTAVTLSENEENTIAIPQDGSDVAINMYGLWSPAAKLQVTYNQGDMADPYTIEVKQASISDTTFSFETSSDVVPPSDIAIFEGWSYMNASGEKVMIGAGETCSDIPLTTTAVTMTAVWKEPLPGGSTVSAGTQTLLEGEPYTLGTGSWTVSGSNGGDNCVYTGGREFYIPATGDYNFVAN